MSTKAGLNGDTVLEMEHDNPVLKEGAKRGFTKGFRPGFLDRFAQARGEAKLKRLAEEIRKLHMETPLAKWQRDRIDEIRAAAEFHVKKMYEKAKAMEMGLLEEYAQHEIDFIHGSRAWRNDNPGKEWAPGALGKVGIMAKAFWKNFTKQGAKLGVSYGENTQGN